MPLSTPLRAIPIYCSLVCPCFVVGFVKRADNVERGNVVQALLDVTRAQGSPPHCRTSLILVCKQRFFEQGWVRSACTRVSVSRGIGTRSCNKKRPHGENPFHPYSSITCEKLRYVRGGQHKNKLMTGIKVSEASRCKINLTSSDEYSMYLTQGSLRAFSSSSRRQRLRHAPPCIFHVGHQSKL